MVWRLYVILKLILRDNVLLSPSSLDLLRLRKSTRVIGISIWHDVRINFEIKDYSSLIFNVSIYRDLCLKNVFTSEFQVWTKHSDHPEILQGIGGKDFSPLAIDKHAT